METNKSMRLCAAMAALIWTAALTLFTGGGIASAQAQQSSLPDHVAALKASLAASKSALKQYEWIQTTVVSLKGEEKSSKQERCYYGADGALEKVEVNESPEHAKKKHGLHRLIAEKKKEELTDYMKNAVSLAHLYVPPSPAKIQASKDAGKASIEMLEPGKRARLNFRDYDKLGDNLGVEVDLVSNRVLGVKVSTYLDDPADAVTLDVHMGQLNDGTTYPADITLDAKAKNLLVTVQNSGYRKTS
jgi:hypothetical protein